MGIVISPIFFNFSLPSTTNRNDMPRILLASMAATLLAIAACKGRREDAPRYDILYGRTDTSVSPARDFFQYANGGWISRNPIPDEQSTWGIANLVMEENLSRLRKICERSAAASPAAGSPERMVGDFWRTAMDSLRTERDGLAALQPLLDRISAMQDVAALGPIVADMRKSGAGVLFSEWVYPDPKDSEVMACHFWQGGLGLPDRDYYLKADSANTAIRTAYRAHIARMLRLLGDDSLQASAAATAVHALETAMAQASRRLEDLRDPYANYHKTALSALPRMVPSFDWAAYLPATGLRAVDSVVVGQPGFFQALDTLLRTTSVVTWRAYLRYHLLQDLSEALPERFAAAAFDFNRRLTGARVRKPRWKRAISSAEAAMGELLGRMYVQEYFDERAKARYARLVEDIREALGERIETLEWMGDSTRRRALSKLASMKKKVGYPDRWRDFSGMRIDTLGWLRNVMEASRWWHDHEMAKLGKPVDRSQWDMYPQTYNAYYNPSNNEIVLPAGIFTVPGLRDDELDDATVYGYAGASTIGHEIIHGFDDDGRKFDEAGNLRNWWSAADEKAFVDRAGRIIRQFDEFEALPGLRLNGRATTGENIADLGGVQLGLQAYRKTREYRENRTIRGFTPVQRYFLGYALGWNEHAREEWLRNIIQTDFHAPPRYRVNGPFANLPEFHEAFGVRPGNPMHRPDSLRVRIW